MRPRSAMVSKSSGSPGITGRCARNRMKLAQSTMEPTAAPLGSTVSRNNALFSKVEPQGVRMTPPGRVCATQEYGTVCTEQVAITRS